MFRPAAGELGTVWASVASQHRHSNDVLHHVGWYEDTQANCYRKGLPHEQEEEEIMEMCNAEMETE